MSNPLCGYVHSDNAIAKFLDESPMAFQAPRLLSSEGKDAFLWEIEKQLTGSVRPAHNQLIGDCVSHGFTGASEDLQFVQMLANPGNTFQWLSSEVTYGLARVQVGRGSLGSQDGAIVAWAFQSAQQFGFVPRGVYGPYDLTKYNAALARRFGTPGIGCPPDLLAEARSHTVLQCNLLQGGDLFAQACDVIYNGGAVVTGSNQLFADRRDAQGFCRPQGNGGHCTYYRGFHRSGPRPGIVYQASWGQDNPVGGAVDLVLPGGRPVTLPAGSFFVDADTFNQMHSTSYSEVWALWSEAGFLAADDAVGFQFA